MKPKTLLIVVALLAVLSAAAWFFNRPATPPSLADTRIGRPLLSAADAEKAARVRVSEKGKTVELSRDGDAGWRVDSYHGLPADFSKLATLVKALASTDVERLVTSAPDRIRRLEFADTSVAVLDANGKTLLALVLGKDAESGGGRYLRFGEENKAYLARFTAWLDAEPKNWADAALVKFAPADIAKVSIAFASGDPVVVSRPSAGAPFASEKTPDGKRLKSDTVTGLLSTLSGLRFTETSALDDPKAVGARAAARAVTLTTFDGKTLAFALGRQPERTVAKDQAVKADPKSLLDPAAKPEPAALVGPVTEKLPPGPAFAFITHSDASNPVNNLMTRRAFQVGEHVLTALPTAADALFEPVPAPKAP